MRPPTMESINSKPIQMLRKEPLIMTGILFTMDLMLLRAYSPMAVEETEFLASRLSIKRE